MMGTLKLAGMRHAYDDVMSDAVKRQHAPARVVGDLLKAEIDEKQARSIKYQMTIAKLPLAKDITGFDFTGTVRISVCGRAVEHYAAMALMKRSPKMTANWAFAMDHSRGGIFHSFSDRFKIR